MIGTPDSSISKADEILPKSPKIFSAEDFSQLFDLCFQRPWLAYFNPALYYLWFNADNNFQKKLLEKLLLDFLYLTDNDVREVCKKISNQIETEWKLVPPDTIIIATCNGKEPDGSQMLIQKIKNKFDIKWREQNFLSHFSYLEDHLTHNLNIVLLDDFIGTGKTISGRIETVNNLIKEKQCNNVKLFLVSAAAMNFAKSTLDNLYINHYSANWLDRGISESFEGSERVQAVAEMKNLEKKLSSKWDALKLPSFGYGQSESLFSNGDSNVPNNVFPIFWWPYDNDGKERIRLFKRVSQRQ